jgi:hypothetical protein
MERFFVRVAAVGALVCLLGSLVFGQSTRTWVSGVGDDVNPCSRTAPCKTFAGAISKTAVGGEIDVLDPGSFGAVTITKSISIEANGLIAGVFASGSNGILINAASSPTAVVVVLRGLTLEGIGTGLAGISFVSGGPLGGGSLYVEHCFINGFQTGISIAPGSGTSNIFITNTTVRNNKNDGIQFAPTGSASVTGTLDQVATENNGVAGLEADGLVQLSFANSTSASNVTGLLASGAGATIYYHESTVFANTTNLSPVSGGQITPD